ncbi:CHAT domain-containing protein [Boletus coccyginus]|nr:CHAT domain-containing protein [Boletus coccyginus]
MSSDPYPECVGLAQGREESPGPSPEPQNLPFISSSATHTHEVEEMLAEITNVKVGIRATDVTLGLRRVPAGFYTIVHHSGFEWRTENKRSSVNHDLVEWGGPIPMRVFPAQTGVRPNRVRRPSDLSATPTLGDGEQLREITVTVEQLLGHNAKDVLSGYSHVTVFTLFPKDGDVVSPCSSILVTINGQNFQGSDPSTSKVLGPHCSITDSRGELEDATNQGHSALSRYRECGDKRDLEHSAEEFERALSICPLDDPCLAVAQSNLAMAKFILCQVEDTNASFEVPLGLYRNVLGVRPVGHLDRPSTLIQLAMMHFALFEKQRVGVEKARAEAFLHEAIELGSTDSHEKRTAAWALRLFAGCREGFAQADRRSSVEQESTSRPTDEDPRILSARLVHRFERSGDLADLQQAIAVLEESVGSTSVPDDRYSGLLAKLGMALWDRFNQFKELSDLEDAISRLRNAVDLTPHGHPHKPSLFNNLGNCFFTRFHCLEEPSDIEDAISTFSSAVDLTPHGHPDKPGCLNNLSNSFFARFKRLGELRDLDYAISTLRDAVDLTPHGHSHKPVRLSYLGNFLVTRFDHFGELSDLGDAILRQRDAIDLTPHGHPHKPGCLNNLGKSFFMRFGRLGEPSDLEDAISAFRSAIDLTPHDHPNKPACLHNLGNSFLARFKHLGELSDLEDAISRLRDAADLTPHGHHNKPSYLNGLGNSSITRFERFGDLSDLEDAISRFRDAVDLSPHGLLDKPGYLNNLGNSLIARFERLGKLCDLEDAISTLSDAVGLTSQGHPHRAGYLNNLGSTFLARFERLGELSDLEHAISMLRDAVDLAPHGHPHKPGRLNYLGISLRARFERLGELSDLEDAISTLRDAVDLTPHGHPHKPGHLSNLGISFLTRFERLGELSDLEHAISRQRDAVVLTPHGHPQKPACLNNLGNSFRARFERLGELSDLEHSISILRDAIDLTPHDHHDKPSRLNNLGNCFRVRFERLGELSDIEDAILTMRDAVDLTSHGDPHKPGCLNNLGNSFFTRFERLGELSDLEHAISRFRDAVDLTPHGHPDKPDRLNNLAKSFFARSGYLGDLNDVEQAISLYSHAASAPVGPTRIRFHASRKWISCARQIHHPSLLDACSVAIALLPQLAWIGLSLSHRYYELMRGADVVREAAAAALDSGLAEIAVEWLEQGRSIVWGELFQLRSAYEELSSAYPDHARRLQQLGAALEHAGATREKSLSALSERAPSAVHYATEFLQQEADRHRALAIERDKLLHEIRSFPGFGRFLLHKEFSRLQASAHSGPVVIINATENRCDALIVLADVDRVIHVPLPSFSFTRSANLQNVLGRLLGHARVIRFDERMGKGATRGGISWESLLSTLWNSVVKPVLDALAFSTPGDLSRVFWCPTGPLVFLPIHAAGFYDTPHMQPGHKVSDFVISSYIPTLSILALSPNPGVAPGGDPRLLAVRQPPSDGLSHLPGVATELGHIKEVIRNSPSAHVTLLESSDGTVEEVLSLMKEADWIHFACHGIQDAANPANSGLCLADQRRLKLRDIIALARPHGGLAFLSACQTAMGDERLTDEAIHITAGMLFAGYGGVIGTMWSISDKLAPDVARDVYGQLFRSGTRPDYRDAARALHDAIGRLRHSNASFIEWLPFIHVGL